MDVEVKKSEIHGRGVFAKKDFKKGEVVMRWHPIKLSLEEEKNLTKEQEENTISKIFLKYGLSQKVADWMSAQRDIFLYNQISIMANESTVKKPTPKKVKKIKKRKKKQKLS